jgi:ribosomal protein S6--L-glutamate ligase
MKIAILSARRTLYSTQRLAEVGRKRGHDMRVLHPGRCLLAIIDGQMEIVSEGLVQRDYDAVIPRIGSSMSEHGLPLLAQFELQGTRSLNAHAAVMASRDKLGALQRLASAGVPVPETMAIYDSIQIQDALDRVGGTPVILKLLKGTQGIGVIKAESVDQTRSTLETLWSLGETVFLQRYVSESSGRDVRAFVVGDTVVAAMLRQAQTGEFRSNLHRGGTSEPIRLSADQEEVALKATAALGLTMAGVDMLISERGPLVIEVNASPGLEGIETTTGKDVARAIIKHLEAQG